MPKHPALKDRRTPCPVALCLDIVGDKWTLLVIRDLMAGKTRFKALLESPEHIATNTLSERLTRLQHFGIIEVIEAADGTRHPAYQLTPKGHDLRPILAAMRDWGLNWEPSAEARIAL